MIDDQSWEGLFEKSIPSTPPKIFRGIIKRKHIHDCIHKKEDFFYMDTGYFGNFISPGNPSGKKIYHRIVKNELQKSKIEVKSPDRWESLIKGDNRLKWPGWKKNGDKILLVISNPKSCHYFGYDMQQWLDSTIAEIKKHTDMPIIMKHKGSRSDRNTHTIYDVLDTGIFATVAFNSIAAIESIAYGIPAFTTVSCAASPLSSTNLSNILNPYYPDASEVYNHCCNLAHGQFTYQEIADGTAWRLLNQ